MRAAPPEMRPLGVADDIVPGFNIQAKEEPDPLKYSPTKAPPPVTDPKNPLGLVLPAGHDRPMNR